MRGTTSGIKPENSFSALSPLSPTVARYARHSHPSPPEEKAASRRKSRLRRKKTAPVEVGVGGCVGGGIEGRAQNIAPLHLMRCMIVGCSGMEMGEKSAPREKQRLWLAGQDCGYRFVGEIADLA